MRFLLDTNVLSDARKKASPALMRWISGQHVDDLAISAVTVLELERGVLRKERSDPAGAAVLRRWLDRDVAPLFSGRVLPIDGDVARVAAGLLVPDPLPEMDALVAATALVHGLTVVTRNVEDFRRIDVDLFDPWTAGSG